MKLLITGKGAAGNILNNPDKYPGITHIVSIGTNEWIQKLPNGFDAHPAKHKLRLEFFDISIDQRQEMNGPSKKDIIKLVMFFDEALKEKDCSFLIHCFAGKSRSTAAGLILLSMFYKDAVRAKKELYALVPVATPNSRMLKLASEIFKKE